jgi:hypothetical protein
MFDKAPNNAVNTAEHTAPKEGVIIELEINGNAMAVSYCSLEVRHPRCVQNIIE